MNEAVHMLAKLPGDLARCSACGGTEFETADGKRGSVRSCKGLGGIGHFGDANAHLSDSVTCVGCGANVGKVVTNTHEKHRPSRNIGGG